MAVYIPDFPDQEDVINTIGESISTRFKSQRVGYDWYFYSKYNYSLYTSDETYPRKYDYKNDTTVTASVPFYYDDRFEYRLAYVPIDESTGLYLIRGYRDVGGYTDEIEIYYVDFNEGTNALLNSYDYGAISGFDSISFLGVSKLEGDVNCVFAILYDTGSFIFQGYFLIYNYLSNSFDLVNGPNDVDDNYYFQRFNHPKDYVDMGGGVLAISVDTAYTPTTPSYNAKSYVVLLDTVNKTTINVMFPRDVHNPVQTNDYTYDIYKYFSIVPYFDDNCVYVQALYNVYNGSGWDYYTRILKIDIAGNLSVIATLSYTVPPTQYNGFGLTENRSNVISYRYDVSGSLIYYDVLNTTQLFEELYFTKTLISPTMDEVDNSIISLKYATGNISLNKTNTSGSVTKIVDIDSLFGCPTYGTISFIRLVEDVVMYSTNTGTNYLAIHYTTPATGNYFRAIMW